MLVTIALGSFAGCKAPETWPYRSLACLPGTADRTAPEYWAQCQSQDSQAASTTSPDLQGMRFQSLPSPGTVHAVPVSEAAQFEPGPNSARAFSETQAMHPATSRDLNVTATAAIAQGDVRTASHQTPVVPPVVVMVQETPELQKDELQKDPLRLPSDLPGANTPPMVAPSSKAPDSPEYRDEMRKLFPALPTVPEDPRALPDPKLGKTGLEALHQIARGNHPGLRVAAANVEAARGLMVQAGLPPNPTVGYQADTVRTLNTPGYKGAYLQQTIITARKLGLAAEAAAVDYSNAMIEQRKTWITVTSSIRRSYFQVLAARQRLVLAKALLELSERAYAAQIQLVAAGEAAPYEPLQLRVLTTQARATTIRAQQDAIAAWRGLAAATGVPDLDVSALEGRIDCSVPQITYEDALTRLSAVHTDLEIAQNTIQKRRTLVSLADRTPIPDLDVGIVVQRDYTFEPGGATYNLMLGGAIPVLNQNQGNRIAARAELVRASQNVSNTRNGLIGELAGAYGIYEANRQLAATFKTDALQDQVRAYRGVYQRYLADPSGVSFNDVIVAQQTVAAVLSQYVDILGAQWQSVVDLGELLQVDDVFEMGQLVDVAVIPPLGIDE
jgi:outer membrane protein, heavy metal efflux system